MGGRPREGDAPRMLTGLTHRAPSLLALAVTGMLAWAGQSPALGASCAPGTADKPDLGFVDSNCDGIDGDKANAIFVAPGGSDNNDGSFGKPKLTMQAAIDVAAAAHKDVYAASGTYAGKVAFLANQNVGVYGGYDPQAWQRSAANVTTFEAPGQVVGAAIPGVVLQLLALHSTSGSVNSTGVRAWGQATVALSRVSIQTANGANGFDGTAPPAQPAAAPAGAAGIDGCGAWGAAGGSGSGHLSGGAGGTEADPNAQFKGHDGQGEPGVIGGIGAPYAGQNGGTGQGGANGLAGAGGSAALNRVSLYYQAAPGGAGGAGHRGAGGGGGASSATINCLSGAGGGAGGLGGTGGQGAQGGGGSLGVFAGQGAHVLILDGTAIHTGAGGKGGIGGFGQAGGPGGKGGPAGKHTFNAKDYFSGAGGDGGYGGTGGWGGGGAGGASIGILTVDARALMTAGSSFTIGGGGAGGKGGADGAPGVAAESADVTTAGGTRPGFGDFDADGIADDADACPIVAGTGNGCPADAPAGPVAGDPAATAPPTATTAADTGTGTTAVAVLPASSCIAKTVFRVRLNVRKAHIRTARLTLDGHRLKLVKGKRRWTAKVDLRHSTRTRHTLTIRGKLRSGKRFKQARHYVTCA